MWNCAEGKWKGESGEWTLWKEQVMDVMEQKSDWVHLRLSRLPPVSWMYIQHIGQLYGLCGALTLTTTYFTVLCTTLSSSLCQRAEGRARTHTHTHRKEGNHAKLNNAVAQSPHYDLVNGWLYKHSDPLGLPSLTAQSEAWMDLWTHLSLSRLGVNSS